MFEDKKVVATLSDKVNELIKKYQELSVSNEKLRNELVAAKAQNEALNLQLSKLEEDIIVKNLNEDDLFKQIESILEEK